MKLKHLLKRLLQTFTTYFQTIFRGRKFPRQFKELLLFLRLVMKMTWVTIDQSLFCLVFSKYLKQSCLERFNILSEHNSISQKQFGFQQGQSIEHAITQLIDQINIFENNCFTSGIFIDLSKAFDTLNHKILI